MPKNYLQSFRSSKGFTMIELLVVMVTMVLIFTVGIANFRGSQKRQELSNAVLSVKTDLRYAQQLALAGKKPTTGCDDLRGYKFKYVSATTYQIYANCNLAGVVTDIPLTSTAIDISKKYPNIALSAFSDILFYSLGRGVNTSANIVITLTQSGAATQNITVTKGGEIN